MSGICKRERLTIEQRRKVLQEYLSIPVGPRGGKWQGMVGLLARKWGVSQDFIENLVREQHAKYGH